MTHSPAYRSCAQSQVQGTERGGVRLPVLLRRENKSYCLLRCRSGREEVRKGSRHRRAEKELRVFHFSNITEKVIHESQKEKDAHYKIPVILPKNHVSNDLYTFQVQKEITKMAGRVMDMMDYLNQGLNQKRDMAILIDEINAQEEYVDEMNHEISWFLQKCSRLPTAPAVRSLIIK